MGEEVGQRREERPSELAIHSLYKHGMVLFACKPTKSHSPTLFHFLEYVGTQSQKNVMISKGSKPNLLFLAFVTLLIHVLQLTPCLKKP